MASATEKGPASLHTAINMYFNMQKIIPWSYSRYNSQREGFRLLLAEVLIKWAKAVWASEDGNHVWEDAENLAQFRIVQDWFNTFF